MVHATKKISAVLGLTFALAAGVGCAVETDDEFVVTRGGKHKPKHCTRTMGWWRNHSVYAEQPNQQIPWPISEDSEGCGDTWYNWLWTQPEGDAWIILAHQWITAQLNWGAGAPVTPEIEAAIYDGAYYLSYNNCAIADEDREDALAISELLDSYNNGLEGVASCDSLEEE